MNSLIDFLIRASISLTLLYLVYWFFLRQKTLFKVIRYYLIFSLVVSVILPLIRIKYVVEVTGNGLLEPSVTSPGGQFNGIMGSLENITPGGIIGIILGFVYFFGASFFLARLISQVWILLSGIRRSGFYEVEGVKVVENNKYCIPFSFFNFIFINPQYINTDELDNILAHERVHIRENHWFDLLIIESISVIFWFNPFVWLIDRSIKQNHEYLADEGVIAQGYSIGRYHSILINQLLGMEVLCMANHLNYSLNAKRLKMMKRKKTPKLRVLNIIWAVPALLFLLIAFARPVYTSNIFPGDNEKAVTGLEDRNIKVSMILKDGNGDPIPGANGEIKGTKIGSVSDKNGKMELTISETDVVVITYFGFETAVLDYEKISKKGKKAGNTYTVDLVMKPKSKELSEKEKKELILKKEAAMKQKQAEEGKSNDGNSPDELVLKMKELDKVIKELALKQKKLEQMEEDESVDKEELAAKQKELQKYMLEINKKRAALEKEAEKQK